MRSDNPVDGLGQESLEQFMSEYRVQLRNTARFNSWILIIAVICVLLAVAGLIVGWWWPASAALVAGIWLIVWARVYARRSIRRATQIMEDVAATRLNDLRSVKEEIEGIEKGLYARNEESTFQLHALILKDVDFFHDLQWEFRPGVNVLLGRNGYGKSLLLRHLAGLLSREDTKIRDLMRKDSHLRLTLERDGEEASIDLGGRWFEDRVGRVPILAIPDSRFIDRSQDVVRPPKGGHDDLKLHGAWHFLNQVPYDDAIQTLLYELCNEWRDHGRNFKRPVFRFVENVVKRLTGEPLGFVSIAPVGRTDYEIHVRTEGSDNPLLIQRASQGTLSVVAMFGQIRSFLAAVHGKDHRDLEKQPGIVLIDELDAHLHPLWQRKITPLLREFFPHVQFFITAHSPLVLAGCLEREVHVLRRPSGEERGFRLETIVRDFVGASAAELYEQVFEIDELDPAVIEHAEWVEMSSEREERLRNLSRQKRDKPLRPDDEIELAALQRESVLRGKVAEVRRDRASDIDRELELKSEIERLKDEVERLRGGGSGAT